MESILAALYHGQLQPDEIVPSHPEYRPLAQLSF